MTTSQLFPIVEQIADKLMADIGSYDEIFNCKKEFQTWLSLSFLGGIVEYDDYRTVSAYGLACIDRNFFKEFANDNA